MLFFAVLTGLALLRLVIAFIPAPLSWIPTLNLVSTAVFVATPIFALFRAAEAKWTPKTALAFLIGGVLSQASLLLFASVLGRSLPALICLSFAQIGLICWCVGLGGLLGTKLKDLNLLVPVTIFLGCFDLFLVFAPVGPTRIIMEAAPKVLPTIGYAIPKLVNAPTAAPIEPFAVVGPADFVFMAMFFIALYRFDMRPRQTLIALVPTLLAYLALSALLGAIPLLPPIAVVVLVVNWRCFTMNKEEKLSTALVAVICILLVAWGATRPKPQPELSQPGAAQGRSAPEGSPAPAASGLRR
jgi:hypothetical protein